MILKWFLIALSFLPLVLGAIYYYRRYQQVMRQEREIVFDATWEGGE